MASFLAVLVSVLAATSVAGNRPSRIDEFMKDVDGAVDTTSVTTTKSSRSSRSSGFISCKTSAFAAKYKASKSANVKASVEVWKEVCSAKPSFKKVLKIATDTAFAFARATASANGKCTSKSIGLAKAKGCGFASASATSAAVAFADAFADAQAEVTAGANPYCSCVDVTAFAEGQADIVQDLFAQAYAYVEATACASGNQVAEANAYVSCYAKTVAKLLAVAYAEIALKGGCHYEAVEAEIVAFVDSQNLEEEECIEFEKTFGPAVTDTVGSTRTRIRRP